MCPRRWAGSVPAVPIRATSGATVRKRRRLVGLLAAGVAVAAAACAETPPPGPTPASPTVTASAGITLSPPGEQCPDDAKAGRPVWLTNSAGYQLAAIELGAGPRGVVLAHQSEGSLCQWLPYGRVLAERGYHVLAFDFAGFGSSTDTETRTYVEDLRTAVEYLRSNGVTTIAIMGASMGATMSIVAAATISPPVDAVIAVSPPVDFEGADAQKAAPSLTAPALFLAGDTDGDYASYAERIYEATPGEPGTDRTLVVLNAPEHGVKLIGDRGLAGAQARQIIEAFLAVTLIPPTTPPAS